MRENNKIANAKIDTNDTASQTLNKAQELLQKEAQTTQNDIKAEFESKSKSDKNEDLIKNVNHQVLINYLSPEIERNEKSKRKHKFILIFLLTIFLIAQFYTVYKLSITTINYAVSDKAKLDILKTLLTFVSTYITSVVIELIAILNYIVKNVFDTSIKELIQLFKE